MTHHRLGAAFIILLIIYCGTGRSVAQQITIPVETGSHAIVLQTDASRILRTVYFGDRLATSDEYASTSSATRLDDANMGIYNAALTPGGSWNLAEPAIQVRHSDGNASLDLKYDSHSTEVISDNAALTRIVLRDPVYPFQVTLCYKVWKKENIIEQWTEITHSESKAVWLDKYASANLYFTNSNFYLTTFHGAWAKEMQPVEVKLERGMRSVDTKLGTRAMLFQSSNFILSFGNPAAEHEGNVILGQLAWSGNFKLEFDVDPYKNLRLIAGINPYASAYLLPAGQLFKTPSLIYSISGKGTGEASRNLHSWARKYRVLDGEGERLTLLNNWEATYFDFDEPKLTALYKDAKNLGVDLFLLDDGWFGNKYPRNADNAGLGDWQENVKKLPHGLGYLVSEAEKKGIKFGIWIEPEMVSPKSELYEKHIDWVIRQPERPEVYYRNQLVLDLSNPDVQEFVFGIVDNLFAKNPSLAFIKWDCNAVIFNAYSAYLDRKGLPQSHLYVEYVRGLYNVLHRFRSKHPKVPMMLCSGGGARADYELLRYFTEFWPSDDTEPLERIFMQWDYSYFFPSIVTDNHVTDWGTQPLKFKVDVASMGKLGFDIVAGELDEKDMTFAKEAVSNYHGFKNTVWHGDLYRLVNPHDNPIAALMYVDPDKARAIVFNYLVDNRQRLIETQRPVKLEGLDPARKYTVKEINLYPGTKTFIHSDTIYSGATLMNVGINPGVNLRRTSVVLEVNEVK